MILKWRLGVKRILLVVIAFLSLTITLAAAEEKSSELAGSRGEGEAVAALKELPLPVPGDESARSYLGLEEGKTFFLTDIAARLIIVEVMSIYCPHCQNAAPLVNELYRLIEADTRLRGEIKIIGIGARNSAYELGLYKEKYGVPFPLLADEDLSVSRTLGARKTPTFFVFKLERGILSQVKFLEGGFKSPENFLQECVVSGKLE